LQNKRRVHIGGAFVLIYEVNEEEKMVTPDPKRRAFTQQREKYATIIMDEMLDLPI
jgi:hypothetical protein